MLSRLVGRNILYEGNCKSKYIVEKKIDCNREEKCREEEEGKLNEEFEAQASMFLPSLYLWL